MDACRNFLLIKIRDISKPYISSKGSILNLQFNLSPANPNKHSYNCPTFIRDGTPKGFNIISKGRPLGKKGISCLGKIREIIPLLPCRPAILSPT